jgi:ribosomal subunit interface protein
LQQYVIDRTLNAVTKFFENAPSGHVHFLKSGYQYKCDIIINEGVKGHIVTKSDAYSNDVYNAFDLALVKMEKQLRKHKSKLKDRHNKVKLSLISSDATSYVINASDDADDSVDYNGDNPAIIAEKKAPILALSVIDAITEMDLRNAPALMFENNQTGRINMVYYRSDGNISWVDSK